MVVRCALIISPKFCPHGTERVRQTAGTGAPISKVEPCPVQVGQNSHGNFQELISAQLMNQCGRLKVEEIAHLKSIRIQLTFRKITVTI